MPHYVSIDQMVYLSVIGRASRINPNKVKIFALKCSVWILCSQKEDDVDSWDSIH